MAAASRRPRGHAVRAIEEALGAVAAPAICDAILATALSRSGAVTTPDGEALVAFVRGPLRMAIGERLGEEVSDEVLGMLGPVIQRIATRASLKPRAVPAPAEAKLASPIETVRPDPSPAPARQRPALDDTEEPSGVVVLRQGKTVRAGEFLPVFLVVSANAEWTRQLALEMVGRAVVRRVAEIFELVEAIEDHRADLPIVIFDCGSPPFHLESVATFASELPPGAWLALLGPQPADDRIARDFAGTTLTIARLRPGETVAGVGQRCLALTH
jgi:hypothetical protein